MQLQYGTTNSRTVAVYIRSTSQFRWFELLLLLAGCLAAFVAVSSPHTVRPSTHSIADAPIVGIGSDEFCNIAERVVVPHCDDSGNSVGDGFVAEPVGVLAPA